MTRFYKKKKTKINTTEAGHKDSGTFEDDEFVLAVFSTNLDHLLFSSLPEMECGHYLSKHQQQEITRSWWVTKIQLYTSELATVQELCAQRIYIPVLIWYYCLIHCIT